MPGYRAFGAETLTAADVMTYLMRQAVIRVPDAIALTAIPAPEVNMTAARDDDPGALYQYNGATWVRVAGGSWVPYTPGTISLNVGNGTLVARWTQTGKTVHTRGLLTFGSTTTIAGSGRIVLPVPPLDLNTVVGSVLAFDTSAGARVAGVGEAANGDSLVADFHTGRIGSATPFAWAVGDQLSWSATYEVA